LSDQTLFAEDSPASPRVELEDAWAWTMPDGFGPSSRGAFAKLSPDGCWLKMSQGFYLSTLEGDLVPYSETWPNSGSMRNGAVSQPQPWVRRISGGESFWWPTATASGFEVKDIPALLERRAKVKAERRNGNGFGLTLGQAVKMWRTPQAGEGNGGGSPATRRAAQGHSVYLRDQVVEAEGGGSLNPMWVEWLMGFPPGWTDLEDSETP
jgi:hypothetical protein